MRKIGISMVAVALAAFLGAGCFITIPGVINGINNVATNVTGVVTNVVPADANVVTPANTATQVLWDAVSCNWMVHGEGTHENEIRAQAISDAAAANKAIRFKFRYTGTDLRFHLLWWESDKDKGKFPQGNMATPTALRAGVRRWVVEASDCDIALVVDTFKAYGDPDHMVQFVSPTADMIKQIGLDAQGVKMTPPRFR